MFRINVSTSILNRFWVDWRILFSDSSFSISVSAILIVTLVLCHVRIVGHHDSQRIMNGLLVPMICN